MPVLTLDRWLRGELPELRSNRVCYSIVVPSFRSHGFWLIASFPRKGNRNSGPETNGDNYSKLYNASDNGAGSSSESFSPDASPVGLNIASVIKRAAFSSC